MLKTSAIHPPSTTHHNSTPSLLIHHPSLNSLHFGKHSDLNETRHQTTTIKGKDLLEYNCGRYVEPAVLLPVRRMTSLRFPLSSIGHHVTTTNAERRKNVTTLKRNSMIVTSQIGAKHLIPSSFGQKSLANETCMPQCNKLISKSINSLSMHDLNQSKKLNTCNCMKFGAGQYSNELDNSQSIILNQRPSHVPIQKRLHDIVKNNRIKNDFRKYYKTGKFIRSGGFSDIYEGKCLVNNCSVILKFIPKKKTKNWLLVQGLRFPSEVLLHKAVCDLPGILNFYDFFEEKSHWVIVIEKLPSSYDLFDYLEKLPTGRLTESTARHFFRQLVTSNLDLIDRGVVHRDIKSENILLNINRLELMLIDFGASAMYKEEPYTDFHGTRQFSTPEYLKTSQYKADSSTVWALGVLLYDMVIGRLPFENDEDILKKEVAITKPLSSRLRDLLNKCLNKSPDLRPKLKDLLSDSWVVGSIQTTPICFSNRDNFVIEHSNDVVVDEDNERDINKPTIYISEDSDQFKNKKINFNSIKPNLQCCTVEHHM